VTRSLSTLLCCLALSSCARTIEIGRDGGAASEQHVGDGSTFDALKDIEDLTPDLLRADARGPSPALVWARSFGGRDGDTTRGVAVDPHSETVFVTGYFQGGADFGGGRITSSGRDVFLASYTRSGEHRWAKGFGTANNVFGDSGAAVAVGPTGDLFLTGDVGEGPVDFGGGALEAGRGDVFVARFSGAGEHRWSHRWTDTYGGSGNYGTTIAVDDAGTVCVGGGYSGAIDFGDGELEFIGDFNPFVLLLDSAGTTRWARGATRGSGDFSTGGRATIASNGQVYLAGDFMTRVSFGGNTLESKGSFDSYLAQFNPNDGVHSWLSGIQSEGADSLSALTADPTGNVTVLSTFRGTMDLGGQVLTAETSSALLVSFSPSAEVRWAVSLGGGSTVYARALALDTTGNLYVGGTFTDTVDFGDGPLTALGASDAFILSLTPTGALRWSLSFGGTGDILHTASISSLAVGSSGTVYAGGSFSTTMTLGETTLQTNGSSDGFIVAFAPPGS